MMQGPTEYSNYIVPKIVLNGSFPSDKNELKKIIDSGVTTFVNLVGEYSL
jgi:hypothetical protein